MAGAYQPTTVRTEGRDEDESTGFCNPFQGRRHRDFENGRQHQPRQQSEGDRQDRVNQWLFTRCVSRQDGQTSEGGSSAVPTPAGSEHHLPGRYTTTETVFPSKLTRAQTLSSEMAYTNEARGSIDSAGSSVFYTQHHINFEDLKDQEFYPQFIQYYEDPDTPRPSIDLAHLPRMTARASIASLSHTLKRGKRKISKSAQNFFGLGDCEEQHANLQRKWTQRRKRHYHKRYGALLDEDAVDAAPHPGKQSTIGSVSSYQSSRQTDPNIVRTLSRRESVASLAWKKVKKMKDEPGVYKSPGKAQPVSMLLEAGRSFSPAVMSQMDDDEVDSAFHPEGVPGFDDGSINDEVFFRFEPDRPRRKKERPGFLPGIEEEKPVSPAVPQEAKDEVEGPPARPRPPIRSARGQRIRDRPQTTNANRREYGKGMVGRWLNRTIKRKRLTSSVKQQMESLSDHRPYFTYWISFVQTVVLIVGLAVYHFAPIGFTETTKEGVIDKSLAGTLVPTKVLRTDAENFWIGPNQAGLIKMGAKFAPCMRPDKNLQKVLEEERRNEIETGCCVKSDGSGCIQTSQKACSKAFADFWKFSKSNNKTRVVCGQDPENCLDPPSIPPDEWDPLDITKWPVCKKNKRNLSPGDYPHMTCEITGRPCCMGNEAKCKIVSKDECDFHNGTYHENKTLCSQVDCLSDTCGMLDFHRKDTPDQVYRLWMAIFAHAGIIHLACTLIFHFTIMRDLEKMAGWLRLSIIYIFSGIGGYLYSAILLPYQAEVGPSGSVFGIIACLFVELFQSWQIIAKPFTALFKLCGIVLLLLLIGLLPYVDNFAHMIGFVFGFLLAFIFLPYISFGEFDRRRKQIQIIVCFALVITLYVVGFLVFYIYQGSSCNGCEYLNCIPFTEDFCKPYNLGQNLQPRTT